MKNLFNLEGKTAIITGASMGIGKGIAINLARAGVDLALVSRKIELLHEISTEIRAMDRKAYCFKTDVTKKIEIEETVHNILQKYPKIDILVNCAGINIRGTVEDFSEENYDKIMCTNLKGTFLFSQAVGRHMIKNNKGKIINFSSLSSVVGGENIPIYSASKGGIKQLTKAMAVAWAKYNINVNAIGPGFFRTDMTSDLYRQEEAREKVLKRIPMKRWGDPMTDMAGTVIFLSSSASDYITGQTIYVDGGYLAY